MELNYLELPYKKNLHILLLLKNSTWIIDIGASSHMISDSNKLTCHKPLSHSAIRTANGSISPVTGEGSIILTDTITLDTLLIVPSLAYNLLSVSQITVTLKCTVTFWPQFCVFQNILARKILGYSVIQGNLYYLELTEKGGQ